MPLFCPESGLQKRIKENPDFLVSMIHKTFLQGSSYARRQAVAIPLYQQAAEENPQVSVTAGGVFMVSGQRKFAGRKIICIFVLFLHM
ncbi:MAG: hypothetical protein J5701_03935 [Bacteroidales bacterium]|nr:hypothetical protein [Bacteroidales bacterium]